MELSFLECQHRGKLNQLRMTRRIWHRSLATFLRIEYLLIILATDKLLISHRMFYGNLCSRQASSNMWQLLLVRLRL